MRRFYDFESDRYHTSIAASVCVLMMGAFFLVFLFTLGGGVEINFSGWAVVGTAVGLILFQLLTGITLVSAVKYLASRPWRKEKKVRRKLTWKRIPLPDADEEGSTWRPFEADPRSNDWPTEKSGK